MRRLPVGVWFVGSTLVALAVVSVMGLRQPRGSGAASSQATAAAESGEALVRLDDQGSLDAALTRFADADSLEPGNPDFKAERAFATLLLGGSLRAESDALFAELSQATLSGDALAALPEADREAVLAKAGALRKKLPVVAGRSDDLDLEGSALAREADHSSVDHSPVVQRAVWLADAFDHRLDRLQAPPLESKDARGHAVPVAPEQLSWWHFARGYAHELSDPSPAGSSAAEAEFGAAVAANPSNLRAKWELARLFGARTPPDDRAAPLLAQILAASPHHEGALREVARAHARQAAAEIR